jgi:hypothetical protein
MRLIEVLHHVFILKKRIKEYEARYLLSAQANELNAPSIFPELP